MVIEPQLQQFEILTFPVIHPAMPPTRLLRLELAVTVIGMKLVTLVTFAAGRVTIPV